MGRNLSTRHNGPEGERRALDLFIALSRAADWMQKGATAVAPLPDSVTLTQFGVLEALYHLGPMCQADVGRKLLTSKGNVSVVIDHLVKRGLVIRRAHETDRRYVVCALTDEGQKMISAYFPQIAHGFAESAAVLTAEEQNTLTSLSKKLGRGIQERL